jgi:hypothetical protein
VAIFHLTTKTFSRRDGQSAIAAAAYRSGDRLYDEQAGEEKLYTARRERIAWTGIFAPADAPDWARDRNDLWNEVERTEKRSDARLAREIEVGLPHELTEQQRQRLVTDFVRENFMRKGYVVDVAIHAPHGSADPRNHHAHLLITERTISADGFAPTKDRTMNSVAQLDAWREDWERRVNRYLERHGHEARVDRRSLREQGIDCEPGVHLGYAAAEMARRGARSDRADQLDAIDQRNQFRDATRADMASIEAEIRRLENEQAKQAREERQREVARQAEADRQLAEKQQRAAAIEAQLPGDREAAQRALQQLERQDRQTPPAGRDYADGAREQAREIRAERRADAREEKFWKDQADWHAKGAAQPVRQGSEKQSGQGLHVIDGATGAVSRLGDFVVDFLGGSTQETQPRRAGDDVRSFLENPASRRAEMAERSAARRQQADTEHALEEIAKDMKAGRNLKSEDIKRLTREHLEQIRHFGDEVVRQMAREAEKRAEAYWKGHGRERDRNWWES